ncbi:putative RNA methyltransferase [Agromyces sp. MMS24-JH15]|uniref:putative RNA methyltransferase n=1 Tax=Agromyces sp. MMS24-JH15 TaxID=3243765 RepID=UPI00374880D1
MKVDSTWFRCPNCLLDLDASGERTLGCANGHRFDEAKQGYVTLLPPRAPRTIGDDRSMLEARDAMLAGGTFARIADAVAGLAGPALVADGGSRTSPSGPAPRTPHPPSIADLGCGTGYYAHAVAARHPDARVLLADRSPDAVKFSLRALDGRTGRASGVVLDLWRPLPLRDGVADVILDVFAPRNPPEFARLLAPHGRLVVVVPTERHLQELRAAGAMLDVPEGKADQVIGSFAPQELDLVERLAVDYQAPVDASLRAQLIGMGPSAHHHRVDDRGGPSEPAGDAASAVTVTVTVSVDVLAFSRA